MNPDTLMQTLLKMSEDIGKTKEMVSNHHTDLFPKMEKSIDKIETKMEEIDHRTIKLDSWKNGIIDLVIDEKQKVLDTLRAESKDSFEVFNKRVEILEERKKKGDKFVGEVKKTVFTKTTALITTGIGLLFAWLMK